MLHSRSRWQFVKCHPKCDPDNIIIDIIPGYAIDGFGIRKFDLDSFESPRPKTSQDSIYRYQDEKILPGYGKRHRQSLFLPRSYVRLGLAFPILHIRKLEEGKSPAMFV